MHKSRIGGIFIDHPAQSFDASRTFWAAVTGREPNDSEDGVYASLGTFEGQVLVEVQQLGDAAGPRVHLDVETDDIEAEVARLEKLGAKRLATFDDGHWQMLDPGGLVFCVIPPHTLDFEQRATDWP